MTPWTAARQTSLPFISPGVCSNSCPLGWWCHPAISSSVALFSSCHQSFLAAGFFSNESALLIRWPKYWSFNYSISLSNENSGLISFKIDWFEPLAVQGTLKSLLQLHNSKASILLCSFFFIRVTLYRRQGSRPSPWKRNAKKQNGCLGRPYK